MSTQILGCECDCLHIQLLSSKIIFFLKRILSPTVIEEPVVTGLSTLDTKVLVQNPHHIILIMFRVSESVLSLQYDVQLNELYLIELV